MAQIIPFKVVTPSKSKASLVPSRSYQSYNATELKLKMANNPYSFLHVISPNYNKNKKNVARYKAIRDTYLNFKNKSVFISEKAPVFYIHKIVNHLGLVFNGIVAAASCEDYKNNIIKKHEDTIVKREHTFKTYLDGVGFNAEPVLLTYPDSAIISKSIRDIQATSPDTTFTMNYGDSHSLWKVDNAEIIQKIIDEFQTIDSIYIADGHHRFASSYLLYEAKKAKDICHNKKMPYGFCMSYLIPESELVIKAFHRLIKSLNGFTKQAFFNALALYYTLDKTDVNHCVPKTQKSFGMYLEGEFYMLHLKKGSYKIKNALDNLDAHILFKTILKPILGITDLRGSNQISYVDSEQGVASVKTSVDSKAYDIGFYVYPTTVEQMKEIADNGLSMPPKSTYILPKLRSGVTIYEL